MKAFILPVLIFLACCGSARAQGCHFVERDGGRLALCGQPYCYCGVNYWYGMNLASGGPGGDRARLLRELDALVSLGVTNLRIMAGSEGPDTEPWRMVPSLQPEPGVYNADVLDGLDFLLGAMRDRGLRAVMCLTNFWQWSGGMAQYVSWNGGGPIPYPAPEPGGDWNEYQGYASDFYSSDSANEDYRDFILFLVRRVNPYTGIAYRDDPAIMSWELANEPRGFHDNEEAFNLWIDGTAAYIKSIDPNHLVTTGSEGDTPLPSWNGLDFTANHDGPDIDYATIHIWPENWDWYDPADPGGTFDAAIANARDYLDDHAAAAAALGKPVILEEFGLARDGGSYDSAAATALRDSFLAVMYDAVYVSASGGGPAAGDNVWAWAGEGRPLEPYGGYWSPGDPWTGDPPHERQGWYGVYDADSTTLRVISYHARSMNALMHTHANHARGAEGLSMDSYPHPANATVAIQFVVPEPGDVEMGIYDVTGSEIRKMYKKFNAGRGEIVWDGTNGSGLAVASGVYLARVRAGGAAAETKIILIR
jgi:mannan endo-1,4-beta-mannosidase